MCQIDLFILMSKLSLNYICLENLILHRDMKINLVSLLNGISTLLRLFNAKAILLEEQ